MALVVLNVQHCIWGRGRGAETEVKFVAELRVLTVEVGRLGDLGSWVGLEVGELGNFGSWP